MFDFIFMILLFAIFGRLAVFAIRMAWSITKIILTIILLPLLLVFALFNGLIIFAFPALIVIGILSLIFVK